MKIFHTEEASGNVTRKQAAATPGPHRAEPAPNPFETSPRQAAQRRVVTQLKNGNKGGGKKDGDKRQVSEAEMRKRRQQSKDDRQANNAAKYSVDAVRQQEKKLSAKEVREINKEVEGHASRDGNKKQNAATTKSLAEARKATERKIAEKKQQERARQEKEAEDWKRNFHQDKKDRGGAGGGLGILVGAQ
ncbi:MAG: hypothetical protein ACOZJX_00570 [Pseudomonadota bacterium]